MNLIQSVLLGEIRIKDKVIIAVLMFALLITLASCGTRKLIGNEAKTSQTPMPIGTVKLVPASLRFVVMADCRGSDGGIDKKIIIKTLESIKKITLQPSFAVMPGDLVTVLLLIRRLRRLSCC